MGELGAQPPLVFFDPLGMLNGDVSQERFDRLRYVEIKHGRICQLAFLGQVVTRAGIHLPGSINYAGDSFDSYPNGIAALFGPDSIPTAGLVQIISFVGILECAFMRDVEGTGNEFVGDFRNGYIDFGWDTFDEEEKLSKRAIELNNGRAAMMGIIGLAGNYFAAISSSIMKFGYERNVSLRGAPYDFRRAPNEMEDYLINVKLLVEDTFNKNEGKKTVLITHSMGSSIIAYFLSLQSQEWKDKYIQAWISLAGCFAGTIKAMKVYSEGDNLGVRVLSSTALREQQRTSPSLSFLLPSDKLWSSDEILVETSTRNYTVHDLQDFFNDIGFPDGYH